MKKLVKFILVLAVFACLGAFIYFKFINSNDKTEYLTINPILGDLRNSVMAVGEISARELVDVGAQVGGQIESLNVEVGDRVKKGDLIASIDSVKQKNEVENKKAQHEIYLAELNSAQISAKIAKSKYDRELRLFKAKASSKDALENAENDLSLKNSKVEILKAQIRQNQISLDTAMTNLGYTQILSPLDGTVVSVAVKEGQTVNANQTTPLIVQIADLTKLEINMEVSEGDLPKIAEGMRVRYSVLSDPNVKFEGVISKIDPAMTTLSDTKGNTTNSSSGSNSAVYYYAKVLVENSDNFLKIGMTTENEIVIDESLDTLFIPRNGVFSEDNKSFVKVLDGEKLLKKEVSLGISDGFYQEILSGVSKDDKVVINDSSRANKNYTNVRLRH